MNYEFKYKDEKIETGVAVTKDGTVVTIGDNLYKVNPLSAGKFLIESNGIKKTVCCVVKDGRAFVDVDAVLLELNLAVQDDSVSGGADAHAGEKDKVFAPMPGKVVKLLVNEGDEVEERQPLVIVEAMKMENQVNSAAKGRVKKINFKAGDQVGTEKPIIELELAGD